jgi:hypothetical protein
VAAAARRVGPLRRFRGFVEFDADVADAYDPEITAAELHFYWSQIEPSPGMFDWSRIDAAIAPWVAGGKEVVLRVSAAGDGAYDPTAGHATPAWVYAAGVPSVTTPDGSVLPLYWNATFEADWKGFIAAFGAHYDGDHAIAYIEAGIGEDGETLAETETDDPGRTSRWLRAGWTIARWTAYVETMVQAYRHAFTATPFAVMVDSTYFRPNEVALVRLETWMVHVGVPQLQTNGLVPGLSEPSIWHDVVVSAEERNCACADGLSLPSEVDDALQGLHASWISLYRSDLVARSQAHFLATVAATRWR